MKSSITCLTLLLLLSACTYSVGESRKNVLFISIDDLRPTLGCYGDKTAITPNIDKIAKNGTTFYRAYCQQALCSPSRLSLLTGLRPNSTKVWDLNVHFREAVPEAVTLPQHFKNQSAYFEINNRMRDKIYRFKSSKSWSFKNQCSAFIDDIIKNKVKINRAEEGTKDIKLIEKIWKNFVNI